MPNNALETSSLETSVRRERRRLFHFIRKRIGSASEAEDILQDVLFQLASRDGTVTEPLENLAAWLFTVARRKVIDWYRKHRRAAPSIGGDREQPFDVDGDLFDTADGPDRAYWRSEFWSELADALDELPEAQRDAFVAHELEGESFKEMAARTGEPINTLLSRKRYAVLYLRERLRDLYDGLESRQTGGWL